MTYVCPGFGPTGDGLSLIECRIQFKELVNENNFPSFLGDQFIHVVDKKGQDSLDIFNQLFRHILGDKLHTDVVEFGEEPHVLDVGCGSGLWPILMAQELETILAPMHLNSPNLPSILAAYRHIILPEKIPQTVTFTTVDIEGEWTKEILNHAPYDLINCRMKKGSIKSWSTLYGKIATHLKHGTGVFEQFEIDWKFKRNSDPIPEALEKWSTKLHHAMEDHGMSIQCDPEETRSMLLNNGFNDVQERAILLPVNDWQSKDADKKIGRWFNTALTESILPMSIPPLVRTNQNVNAIHDLIAKVSEELHSKKHTQGLYCMLYIWTARAWPLERQQTHTSDDTTTPCS